MIALDPVDRALATAPLEDEEISEEEAQAVARSKEWFQHNQGIPFVRAGTTPWSGRRPALLPR